MIQQILDTILLSNHFLQAAIHLSLDTNDNDSHAKEEVVVLSSPDEPGNYI
jgi:hypothetical protein